MATARINMQHGFMKSIIKNQVDRDNYDKEVKAKNDNSSSPKCRQPRYRPKKPEKQVYVPPFMKKESRQQLFVLEFEDRNGLIHTMDVYKEDVAESLAQELGSKCNLKPAHVSALTDRIQQEIDRRL